MLSRDDCQVLRGLAITSIFIHNFCHWLPSAASENEFGFSEENNTYFLTNVLSSDFLIHLFSYLGHLGVPVFVFLTGYGLAKKYNNNKEISIKAFILHHYKKFFLPMLFGMLGFILIFLVLNGDLWNHWIFTFIGQITLTNNLVAFHGGLVILPGPYWYYGLTMQLYLIYRFFVYRRSLHLLLSLLVLSIIILFFLESNYHLVVWLKMNAIGWLLPFTIGIYLGKKQYRISATRFQWFAICILSGAVVVLFGAEYYTWLFIPAFSVLFFIGLCKCIKGKLYSIFYGVGSISMYIFCIHPLLREVLSATSMNFYGFVIYFVAVILISTVLFRVIHTR